MIFVIETGSGDVIERMWRTLVSARRNEDTPEIWRLTDDIIASVAEFYRLGRDLPDEGRERISRFLDVPVDPTTTAPHLLCYPNVVYHL
jgi:hypothetical protein